LEEVFPSRNITSHSPLDVGLTTFATNLALFLLLSPSAKGRRCLNRPDTVSPLWIRFFFLPAALADVFFFLFVFFLFLVVAVAVLVAVAVAVAVESIVAVAVAAAVVSVAVAVAAAVVSVAVAVPKLRSKSAEVMLRSSSASGSVSWVRWVRN